MRIPRRSTLQGRTALVTGASGGIGAGIAKSLAAAGAAVIVHYGNSSAKADRFAAEIVEQGGVASTAQADIADPAGVADLLAEVGKRHGRIDILVNNAGVFESAPLANVPLKQFGRLFEINVLGVLLATGIDGVDGPRSARRSRILAGGAPPSGADSMSVRTVGLDLAKQVFQVHGVDDAGRPVLKKRLRRAEVRDFFAGLAPCLIGMEACASSHYWARELAAVGHEVRLMPPSYVKPYVKRQKNDAADAEAICEAVTRPNMRFVPVKSEDQQAVLMLHRTRDLMIRQRTALTNALRAHLAELGIVARQGVAGLDALIVSVEKEAGIPALARRALGLLVKELMSMKEQIKAVEAEIMTWHRSNEASRRLETIPGIGPIIASALAATVTDPSVFKSGRQLAAWIGLVPRQSSSGGKERLGHITKQGEPYLRRLLVIGASAVIRFCKIDGSALGGWITALRARRPAMVASVGLANKMARIAWAVLSRGKEFELRSATA